MKYSVRQTREKRPREFKAFSDIVANLLVQRGISTISAAEAFLSPDYDLRTHDPFLMKDMEKAVVRVYKAVKAKEKTVIWSDYDADGIPGGVILHDFFKKIGYTNFENYIPHRHNEGFGLNVDGIDSLKESGTSLIITIDCGIGNVKEVEHANNLGIDVFISDHHVPGSVVPKAFAILNPKTDGCAYPEKMLCGSGVIFKFVQAFLKRYGQEFGVNLGWEKWLLDMVGIATLSDMVPLTGENRIFAYYGLKVLKKTQRLGLQRLFSKLRVNQAVITEDDIGFTISPRINAASRMGEPEQAFRLLSTTDEKEAATYADMLEHVNNERKGTVAALVKEIKKILAERSIEEKNVIVLGNPAWRPSLLGLVANSLSDEYGKPVFLWGRDGDNVIKGSARSKGSAGVLAIMEKAADSFSEYGGHALSGGFAVKESAIFRLEESLEAAFKAAKSVSEDREEFVDAVITLEDVTWNLYRDIERLSPFGTGNPKPLFMIKNARIDAVKQFGKEGNHTEILFKDGNGRRLSAIQFFRSKESLPAYAVATSPIDLVVHLEKSTFKNYPELRLRIVDIL